MNDSPEMIRNQMEETKLHLSEKLESLEQQVSETVQSTGTAVNATVEAVQETVETVTGAVQGAVESVSNAFDIRRQINKHPVLVLGGAAVLGYLAINFLKGRGRRSGPVPVTFPPQSLPENAAVSGVGVNVPEAAAATAIAAAYKAGWEKSFSYQLKGQALVGLLAVAQDVVARTIPLVVDYVAAHHTNRATRTSAETAETTESEEPANQPATPETAPHLHRAPSR